MSEQVQVMEMLEAINNRLTIVERDCNAIARRVGYSRPAPGPEPVKIDTSDSLKRLAKQNAEEAERERLRNLPPMPSIDTDIEPEKSPGQRLMEERKERHRQKLSALAGNNPRNRRIAEEIAGRVGDGLVLVLTELGSHCHELHTVLKRHQRIKAAVVTHDDNSRKREGVLRQVGAGEIGVLVITSRSLSQKPLGLKPAAIILASPVKSTPALVDELCRLLLPSDQAERQWLIGDTLSGLKGLDGSIRTRLRDLFKVSAVGNENFGSGLRNWE